MNVNGFLWYDNHTTLFDTNTVDSTLYQIDKYKEDSEAFATTIMEQNSWVRLNKITIKYIIS